VLIDVILILVGTALFALGFDLFLLPNQFAAGGISGVAMVIVGLTGFGSVGTITAILNIPLFIAGYRRLGRQFFLGSLLGMVSSSLFMDLFATLLPPVEFEPLIAALFGGLVVGGGLGLVFVRNASTGGTDIMARLLRTRFRNLSIGRLMLVVDLVICVVAAVAFRDLTKVLYCIIVLYVSEIAMDSVVYGFDYSRVALIISDHETAIAAAISDQLDRGATFLDGEGTYTGRKKRVILCAVKKQQLAELKELVTDIDPNAFIILQEAHQVLGDGFARYDKDGL
jgi:uncharacterized membrane-anchored protein YitT (DUF2179 family)